jgi:hypothetical protein
VPSQTRLGLGRCAKGTERVEGGERGSFCAWEEGEDMVGLVAGMIRLVRGVDMSAPEFIENGFEMSFPC